MASDLWYPGRVPLCTQDVLPLLNNYITLLHAARNTKDTHYVDAAKGTNKDLYRVLYQEGCSCLGSDTTINDLLTLLKRSQQAAELCARTKQWVDLDAVINALDTVYWGLIAKFNKGETDD